MQQQQQQLAGEEAQATCELLFIYSELLRARSFQTSLRYIYMRDSDARWNDDVQ